MAIALAQLLRNTMDSESPLLAAISDEVAATKTDAKWSRKEELGHLIDSASNNHLRFVRAALEPEFHGVSYDQDRSVALHGYQDLAWSELLEFWRRYNLLLVKLVSGIPESKLNTRCRVGDGAEVSLGFLIADYVTHMQHHLDHILRRDQITQYPAAALCV
jgi:hypothetical protein